jgi:FkbM family methyltransferase
LNIKNYIQYLLQRLLGFEGYLFWFARFKVATLKWDKKENHIFLLKHITLPEGSAILDVGANLGILTVHFARMFPNHPIVAFEPVTENYLILCRMVKFYNLKNVSTYNIGLSDMNGELTMLMPLEGGTRKQGLSHVVTEPTPAATKGKVYHIAAFRLDDWWQSNRPKNSMGLLKMDVENHESKVLSGSADCIRKFRPYVLAELWDNENRVNASAFFEEIGGYSCKVSINNSLVPMDIKNPSFQNFFFSP